MPPDETGIDYRLLFEASADVLLVLRPDAPRFTIVGLTRARMTATHSGPEQVGRGLFEVFPDNPDDPTADGARKLRESLERVVATRAPDTMAVQKYDIRGPDGAFVVRYWSPVNSPVLSAAGEIVYILHRVEDVTELVAATERGEELRGRTLEMEREVIRRGRELAEANLHLRDANARLGQLDAAKTAFFNNVSHEFRTPLTLMLGPLEDGLADADEPLGPRQRERALLAHDNALRLLKLVNALLDFARLEAGRLRACYAPLDIAALTAELAGMFQSAAERAGLSLVVACPPLGDPVWVDRDMWERIVPNLVSNALKFTHAGAITVRVRDEGGQVALEVADTGVGIPEAELPRIFDRFHRVSGAVGRAHEGTGIGLALVRELVSLHGGRVSAQSAVGRGTTIRVEIPRGHAHLPSEAVSSEPVALGVSGAVAAHVAEAARWSGGPTMPAAVGAGEGSAGPRARVLVVDDNADLRHYLCGLLAPIYDVTAAADGQEALEAVRSHRPEIVVSDVMMPRLDGFGLVRALRADPATASLPVILLSARAGEEAAVAGLGTGADDYLVKPFAARELLARVRTHVELSRARRAWTQELERANDELDAFSYSVSHDLRAPLRAIDGFSRILLEEHATGLEAEGRRLLGLVIDNARNMGQLIDDLLAFSRAARGELMQTTVDMAALARAAFREQLGDGGAGRIELRLGDLPKVQGDPALLRQVWANLLSNAIKYSRGRATPVVEVTGARDADRLVFSVCDNGVGFDGEAAGRLFGVFQRLHSARDFDGTGVGLALVKRIVGRHGGDVWAEGREGEGATFGFWLPLASGARG